MGAFDYRDMRPQAFGLAARARKAMRMVAIASAIRFSSTTRDVPCCDSRSILDNQGAGGGSDPGKHRNQRTRLRTSPRSPAVRRLFRSGAEPGRLANAARAGASVAAAAREP